MKFSYKSTIRTLLLALLSVGSCWLAEAQRSITGVVRDVESGEALIGATIIEKGVAGNGAVSDVEGAFSLRVADNATTLVVSYTGYTSVEQDIRGLNSVEVFLTPGALINEVLVIGYGTVKREDATGLVQSVTTEKFNPSIAR